jgi:hypothetical protein
MAKMALLISVAFLRLAGLPVIMSPVGLAIIMGVEKRDIDKAIKNNQLVPGRHFCLIDKHIRFHVTEELFILIMADCDKAAENARKTAPHAQALPATPRRQKNNNFSKNLPERKTA